MSFLGCFSIKDVVPSKEGESSKIKVKVRLDIHGVLNVVDASLVEKLAAAAEPEVESMEVEGQDDKTKEANADAASEVLGDIILDFSQGGAQCGFDHCPQ